MSASLNVTDVARWPGGPFVVSAAEAPNKPNILDLRRPGHLTTMITHDVGMTWPDKRGQQLMHAVLAECGTVFLLFDSRNDAEACRRRLARSA